MMTTQFPTAKVRDRNPGDKRLWAKPLMIASRVCHDKEAEKAPTMKRRMSIEDAVVPALNPSIRVVK